MAKPQVDYLAKLIRNPQTGSEVILPQITGTETVSLAKLVENAISTGNMPGYTVEAGEKEMLCVLAAIAAILKEGYAVRINNYLRIYLDIDGTIKSEYSPLTAENTLGIGAQTLSGFTLGLADFDWVYVGPAAITTQSLDYASVTALMAADKTASNVVGATSTAGVTGKGKALGGITADSVYLRRYVDGECVETVAAGAAVVSNDDFVVFTGGLPVPAASTADWTAEGTKARLVIGRMDGETLVVFTEGPEFTYVA